MASKSKKRRRVFRASCILAALIVAGSSFAWFTSRDEVTNRLTANSDYGVSIVESFTPPKNWLPGQEVNKDVYTVNTGNIDAFVKENVKGVLNFTYEYKANTLDDDCLKLNELEVASIDGVTTEESGGFLAWTDTDEPLGTKNVVVGEGEGWKPTKKGLYIFRRVIQHTTTNHPDGDKFTYAGYYFIPKNGTLPGGGTATEDTYYKIVIGDDKYRAESTDPSKTPTAIQFDLAAPETALQADVAGGTVTINREDGTIEADTLKVYYVKETEVEEKNVTFKYEEQTTTYDPDAAYSDTNHPARLVVEYAAAADAGSTVVNDNGTPADPSDDITTVYNASADAARKEVLYYDALGASNEATMKYLQALADYNYAKALADARDDLISAAQDMQVAVANSAQLASDLVAAWTAVNTAASDLESTTDNATLLALNDDSDTNDTTDETLVSAIGPNTLIPDALRTYITNNAATLPQCQSNMNKIDELWPTIKGYLDTIEADLDWLETAQTSAAACPNPNDVEAKLAELKSTLGKLSTTIDEYYETFAELVLVADASDLSGLNFTSGDTLKALIATYKGYADTMKSSIDTSNGLKDKVAAYRTDYKEYHDDADAGGTAAQELGKWNDAKNTYNEIVGHPDIPASGGNPAQPATGATKTYLDAIADAQRLITNTMSGDTIANQELITLINDTYDYQFEDNRADIVQYYSANRVTDAVDPTLVTPFDSTNPVNGTTKILEEGTWKSPAAAPITEDYEYYAALTSAYDGSATDPEDNQTANPPVFGIAARTNQKVYKSPEKTTFNTADDVTYNAGDAALTTDVLLDTLKGNMDTAVAATSVAKAAYDDAVTVLSGASSIKLYVNLAEDYYDDWTFDTNTDGTTQADFYLNSILNAGETSPMLIDSVTMDNGVSANSYKNLIFDLNVGLDSAQVTYADDQKTYTTTAVEGNSDIFKLKAAVQNNNETVTWTDVNAPTTP